METMARITLAMHPKTPATMNPHLFILQHQAICSIVNVTNPARNAQILTHERANATIERDWAVIITLCKKNSRRNGNVRSGSVVSSQNASTRHSTHVLEGQALAAVIFLLI
jgi:hypothetical protein